MYPAGFYYSSSSGNKAHKSRIHNYVSTLAKNGWAMAGPVGPVPVPMLYGNQVESYLVMWLAILFKNGDEEDNDSRAVFINSATFGFGLVSSCSEHLASSWKLWCKNGGKKKTKKLAVAGSQTLDTWLIQPVLCHWALTTRQPPTHTIFYVYCTGDTECLSYTPGSNSVCAVRTLLGVDWNFFIPSGKNPCWVVFSL